MRPASRRRCAPGGALREHAASVARRQEARDVVRDGAGQDVWVYDIERDTMTRLTFGTQTFVSAIWSPDGRFIICGSIGNGLFWVRADGGGQPQPLVGTGKRISFPHAISSDGKRLVYYEIAGHAADLDRVPEQGDGLKAGTPERYMTTQSADAAAAFSPDGRWLAYESNESGRHEVYVRPFRCRHREGAGSGRYRTTAARGRSGRRRAARFSTGRETR